MCATYKDYTGSMRQAYRTHVSDVVAKLDGLGGAYYATDLSYTGIGFEYASEMKEGTPVTLSLYDHGELVVSHIPARVAHSSGKLTGIYYENLDDEQFEAISDMVETACTDEVGNFDYISPYMV